MKAQTSSYSAEPVAEVKKEKKKKEKKSVGEDGFTEVKAAEREVRDKKKAPLSPEITATKTTASMFEALEVPKHQHHPNHESVA